MQVEPATRASIIHDVIQFICFLWNSHTQGENALQEKRGTMRRAGIVGSYPEIFIPAASRSEPRFPARSHFVITLQFLRLFPAQTNTPLLFIEEQTNPDPQLFFVNTSVMWWRSRDVTVWLWRGATERIMLKRDGSVFGPQLNISAATEKN